MRTQLIRIMTGLVLALGLLAGCGGDEVDVPPATEGTADPAVEGATERADEAPQIGEQLAQDTLSLQRDVTESVQELVSNPEQRDQALERLAAQEEEARLLAERARQQAREAVPAGQETATEDVAQSALVRANEQTGEAARRAQEFAESGQGEEALTQARDALATARSESQSAIEDLSGRLPEDQANRLRELEQQVPELNVP